MKPRRLPLLLALIAAPVLARDSLGMFGNWGAFRDPQVPRCYALAMAAPSTKQRDFQPYADVAFWPRQNVRGQVHFRLSRKLQPGAPLSLQIGGQRIPLTGGGGADVLRVMRYLPGTATNGVSARANVRGGRDNDPRFGSRMTGQGPWADLIRQRFNKTVARLGLNTQRVELDLTQFRRPGQGGSGPLPVQQSLF